MTGAVVHDRAVAKDAAAEDASGTGAGDRPLHATVVDFPARASATSDPVDRARDVRMEIARDGRSAAMNAERSASLVSRMSAMTLRHQQERRELVEAIGKSEDDRRSMAERLAELEGELVRVRHTSEEALRSEERRRIVETTRLASELDDLARRSEEETTAFLASVRDEHGATVERLQRDAKAAVRRVEVERDAETTRRARVEREKEELAAELTTWRSAAAEAGERVESSARRASELDEVLRAMTAEVEAHLADVREADRRLSESVSSVGIDEVDPEGEAHGASGDDHAPAGRRSGGPTTMTGGPGRLPELPDVTDGKD